MKSLVFLFLFTHLCAAIAVPPNSRRAAPALQVRAGGQKLTNPDNEEVYKDKMTLAETSKSQILKFDTPQEETDNRWFDWDQTCKDETDRQKVLLAFKYGYEYATKASRFLQELLDNLPNKPPGKSANKQNIKFIVDEDPAFAQMFYAQDNRINQVKGTFDNLLAGMKSFQGRNKKRAGADGVRFICDREGKVKNVDGESWCG
jgi:hypothetical protein